MEQIKILQLDETLEAARVPLNIRQGIKESIVSTIGLLAEKLNLGHDEILFCFASPHQAPKWELPEDERFPAGFNFVRPDKNIQYDEGSVKFCFWIEQHDTITYKTTCTTFFSEDGSVQIADNDWMPPDWAATELSDHMRKGKEMPHLIGAPRDYVNEQILPLLA